MSSPPKPILYSYWRSSCSWRVRSVLALKNIEYEYRGVSLYTGEQLQTEFQRLNPMGYVPVLVVPTKDGATETLFESLAIVDYLEDLKPEPSIYPKCAILKAKVKGVAELITSGIQPMQNLGCINKAAEYAGGDKSKANEWANFWIDKKFEQLERLLLTLSGKYTVGDELTLADFCLVPQVYNAIRFNVDMNKFPTIKRLHDFLSTQVKVIVDAQPEAMADAF